jgi:protein-tyrosine phosphatase
VSAAQRPWKAASVWLVVLGTLFFATYGGANWLASQRTGVGSIVFDWERAVPFWAWTIVPYWSIDAFYALSLFVCATREELATHVKRLLAAQAIAIACFVAFPLRFAFERPATDGVFGAMFDVLMGFDKPYNQAPSLHIVLLVILWVLYAKHVPARLRWLLHGWFFLIGASVLTTWQHHFIDIPTGVWVGWLCVWLFPEHESSMLSRLALTDDPGRRRIAALYGLTSVAIASPALAVGGTALWLLWIAGSVLLVALIYLTLDETAFQKRTDGGMSAASWWLFAPYFVGAWINSRLWTRRQRRWDAAHPGLLLGRLPGAGDLAEAGVQAVVDLTAELPLRRRGLAYHNIPVLDLTLPSEAQLAAAVRAIDAALRNGPTLVCCALGYSRSALACGAWLLATGRAASADEALAMLRQARPAVVLDERHAGLLRNIAPRSEAP